MCLLNLSEIHFKRDIFINNKIIDINSTIILILTDIYYAVEINDCVLV